MSIFTELSRRNVFRVAAAYTVTAWLIAQVAELALDSFGTPDWVMKTLLLLLALGLPIAVIFAWAFEMTPEGLKREKDVDRTTSITQQTGKKINYLIIGVLAVALAISLLTRRPTPEPAPPLAESEVLAEAAEKSIAVLPFVNMSDDPDNEYFSDGISEELLNVLVKVEGLRVASRTSSFSFKGKDTPIPAIADALKVGHVLEGSVRKAGDTIRITAQLIDVRTDRHLWSETYDRKLEDIFVIQDEISAHIVDALKVALGTVEVTETFSHPTDNLDAYEDYLKAQYLWQRRGEDNIVQAIELFNRALEKDAGFARASAGLAAAHITLPSYSINAQPDEQLALAEQHARRALELDPSIAEAHAVLGDLTRFQQRNNPSAAVEHYLKAIETGPKIATGYLWYAEFLLANGKLNEALEKINLALQLDPMNPGVNSVAGAILWALGDAEESLSRQKTAVELGHPFQKFELAVSLAIHGQHEQAMDVVREHMDEREHKDFELLVSALRNPEERQIFYDSLLPRIPPDQRGFLIREFTVFGDLEMALELLSTGEFVGNDEFYFWMPEMSAFRADPRFISFIETRGKIAYWDEFGWPDICRREKNAVVCD
jgi:TolB-like protein/Flp pilus assembly protein TadD